MHYTVIIERIVYFLTDIYKASTSSLTSGPPLYGNIIVAARRRDKTNNPSFTYRKRSAWTSHSVSSSSSSLSSFDVVSQKDFPEKIPQQPVELELGIIGMQSSSPEGPNCEDTTDKLLAAARRWRQTSRRRRQTMPIEK